MMQRVLLAAAVLLLATVGGVASEGGPIVACYYDGDGTGVYGYIRPAGDYGGWYNNYYMSSNHDLYIKGYFSSELGGLGVNEWGGNEYCGGGTSEGSIPVVNGKFEYFLYDGGTNSSTIKMACYHHPHSLTFIVSNAPFTSYTISGATGCISETTLYIYDSGTYYSTNQSTTDSSYSFEILNGQSYRLLLDSYYYDFVCDGDEVFDLDGCIWVYGYTCGIDAIKLYKDDGGWVLDDTESQDTGYDVYEMLIVDGEDYKISFIDSTIDGDIVVHNQTFSCTGDHVMIDFDRCEWIYPPYPPAPPIPIYIWTGYDYNIVVFRDEHGNFIENSQLAIYDKTDSQYLQRWTDAADGYTLLGTRFNTDHDVLLSLRTFDGVFTLDTTFPANGSAPVGEENITTTNWTIPIKYNLNVLPVDQYGVSLFDVFCGLSEYTPLNPGAFWGMDLSDQGYVPVTNCSGFAMCDIIAEKEGYADYKVEALNWTSKSALVKDYRHNIVMEVV